MSSQPPMSVASTDYSLELVKLLLQVVWADHEVSATEVASLKLFAKNQGLGVEQLAELDSYLQGGSPLPPPNLGLLRLRRVEVLKSVRMLLMQLNMGEEEDSILTELSALLGASSSFPALQK